MTDRKNKRIVTGLRLAVIFLLAAWLLSGCGQREQETQTGERTDTDHLQIGMSFDSFVIERWLRDRDLFELTAKELGAEVNVQVANGDAQEQISQIRYFIKKKVDVIVVIAVDGETLGEVVKEARAEGIRVISYDRLIVNGDTDLYISFDNVKVGELMGQALLEALPEGGNIFVIHGAPADQNVAMVKAGFEQTIQESDLEVVYTAYCENWLAELAFDAVEEGLSKTPRNLVGVMCGNDDLASQAFRALAENKLAGKVVLVGQDAELSACQRIVEGTQTMTVYKPVEQLAKKAAEFAAALGYQKMLEEGRVEEKEIPQIALERSREFETLDQINDDMESGTTAREAGADSVTHMFEGDGNVAYYAIDPVAVTAENMDEVIIDSDFHTREDVYLNVEKNGKG